MPLKCVLDERRDFDPEATSILLAADEGVVTISDCRRPSKRNKQPSSSFSSHLLKLTLTLLSFAALRSIGC
jgi:hypothetical protein